MLIYLLRSSPLDAAIWITIGFLQGLVALACYHGRTFEKYRAFALYINFATLFTFLLMALPPGPGFHVYTWIYYPWTLVQYALIACCVADLYVKALGPKLSLPDWAPRNLAILLSVAVAASLAIGIIFRPAFATAKTIKLLGVAQVVMLYAMALALWILIFYARRLGLGWWPRDAQIAGAFVLMLSVHAIALSIIWTNKEAARLALRIGQFVSISVFGYWSWALWKKEPAPVLATHEEVAEVLANHRDNMQLVTMAKHALE